MNPVRPNASSSATPPTTGGSTSGRVTRARRSRCPGKLLRASTHASGTPMAREINVDADAVHSERIRAWVASAPLRAAPIRPQGARISSPTRGSTRNPTAISAGASKGAGTDREAPPRAARLARSRAVRCDGAATVTAAALGAGGLSGGSFERTAAGRVHRKAEEEPIVELSATKTAPRGARMGDVQPNRTPLTDHYVRGFSNPEAVSTCWPAGDST